MLVFPNAKINIGLNIVGKRPDGYHNIESVFYPVNWADALEVVPAEEFSFQTTGLPIPGDTHNNLILKAVRLLQTYTNCHLDKLTIHLHKVLPMGAGIGGGSADGAFALKALNEVAALNLSVEELQQLARQLGSDCAFFIRNTPAYCFGKGDEFAETPLRLAGKHVLLVYPNFHISTAEAYAGVRPQQWAIPLREALAHPMQEWKTLVKNDFEEGLNRTYPVIGHIKQQLYELGAVYASMTGSGSTIYGIFDEAPSTKIFDNKTVWQGVLK